MPYKNKKKLYAAQRRYRQRQKNRIEQARKELSKTHPNIASLRKLLGVNLRETAESMAFGKPSKAAKHILEVPKPRGRKTSKRGVIEVEQEPNDKKENM